MDRSRNILNGRRRARTHIRRNSALRQQQQADEQTTHATQNKPREMHFVTLKYSFILCAVDCIAQQLKNVSNKALSFASMIKLTWPLPALLAWISSWLFYDALLRAAAPEWIALLLPVFWSGFLTRLTHTTMRKALVGLGFPLSYMGVNGGLNLSLIHISEPTRPY